METTASMATRSGTVSVNSMTVVIVPTTYLLVSLKHSQTEPELDRKGKRRAIGENQQRGSDEEERFYHDRHEAGNTILTRRS